MTYRRLNCDAEEVATCNCCGERFHYEKLGEDGLCYNCRPEEEKADEKT